MPLTKLSRNASADHNHRRKARLRGFSPDGSEIIIDSNGDISISGGTGKNNDKLIKAAKVYLAIIKEYGYDISNLTEIEKNEINNLIKELKDQSDY